MIKIKVLDNVFFKYIIVKNSVKTFCYCQNIVEERNVYLWDFFSSEYSYLFDSRRFKFKIPILSEKSIYDLGKEYIWLFEIYTTPYLLYSDGEKVSRDKHLFYAEFPRRPFCNQTVFDFVRSTLRSLLRPHRFLPV